MKKLIMVLTLASLVVPATFALPSDTPTKGDQKTEKKEKKKKGKKKKGEETKKEFAPTSELPHR